MNPLTEDARQLSPSSVRTFLTISEIMYHPRAAAAGNLEYVELFNTDPIAHDIAGYRLGGDVDYTFPPGATIAARSFLVVAADPAAVQAVYPGATWRGRFTNALPNTGGTVRLRNEQDALLLEVQYTDDPPWPLAADGAGHALVLGKPDFGEGDPAAWPASAYAGGSPGAIDPEPADALRFVRINEFMAHTDLPDSDYIELYNAGTQTATLTGCALSDNVSYPEYAITARRRWRPGSAGSSTARRRGSRSARPATRSSSALPGARACSTRCASDRRPTAWPRDGIRTGRDVPRAGGGDAGGAQRDDAAAGVRW